MAAAAILHFLMINNIEAENHLEFPCIITKFDVFFLYLS